MVFCQVSLKLKNRVWLENITKWKKITFDFGCLTNFITEMNLTKKWYRPCIFGVTSLKTMSLTVTILSYASKINLSLSNSSFSNSTHQKYMDKLIYSLIHLTQSIFVYFIYYIISVLGMYMKFDLLLTEMIRIFVRCIHKILQVIVWSSNL